MWVGALSGRQVYKYVVHPLARMLEQKGIQGLYSCHEACKNILIDEDEEQSDESSAQIF